MALDIAKEKKHRDIQKLLEQAERQRHQQPSQVCACGNNNEKTILERKFVNSHLETSQNLSASWLSNGPCQRQMRRYLDSLRWMR